MMKYDAEDPRVDQLNILKSFFLEATCFLPEPIAVTMK